MNDNYEILNFEIDRSKPKNDKLIYVTPDNLLYNPIFSFKLKNRLVKYYDDDKYKYFYSAPFDINLWKRTNNPKGMKEELYFNMIIDNFVKFGELPSNLLNRSCLICYNDIPRNEDHFYFSFCFHSFCFDCFFKFQVFNSNIYGCFRKCPLCTRELRNWTDSQNIFTKKYLKPIKFKDRKIIFLDDNNLKRLYMIFNIYIKCYIDTKTGEYKREQTFFFLKK